MLRFCSNGKEGDQRRVRELVGIGCRGPNHRNFNEDILMRSQTAMIELKKLSDDKLDLCIGEEEQKFSISFPKDYPNTKEKFVSKSWPLDAN